MNTEGLRFNSGNLQAELGKLSNLNLRKLQPGKVANTKLDGSVALLAIKQLTTVRCRLGRSTLMVLRFSAMALPPGLSLREPPSIAVRLPPARPSSGEDEQKPFVREPEDFGWRLIQVPAGRHSKRIETFSSCPSSDSLQYLNVLQESTNLPHQHQTCQGRKFEI